MTTNAARWAAAWLGLAALALMFVSACAPEPRKAGGVLDTPEHHTLRGNDLIEEGNWTGAEREFDLALSLDSDYGPAQAGKAVVVAHGADNPAADAKAREAAFDEADDLLDEAASNAKNDRDSRAVHVAAIRVHTLTRMPEDDWRDEAQDHFEDAVDTDGAEQDPDPYFYMARAERQAFRLPESSALYQRVLAMDKGRTKQADTELAVVQKVIRAKPGSRYGKLIAFLEQVNRADMAALFIGELQLSRLYTRGDQVVDNSFQPPEDDTFQTETLVAAPPATDIDSHPLRTDIETVLKLGVVGLEPDPAHLFHPDKGVSRAEFALMVEDILVKVTGESGVRTRFIGQPSPFPDVRNDLPYFNAVQTVVSRSLMEPKDKVRGMFAPLAPVSGADALLVIRMLRDELRSYLRS